MIYGFEKADASALTRLARIARNGNGDAGDNRGLDLRPKGNEKRLCKTTSAIPARSGDTAGSVDDAVPYSIAEDGALTSEDAEMTVYNPWGGEVASGTYITVVSVGGRWIVDAEDCGA